MKPLVLALLLGLSPLGSPVAQAQSDELGGALNPAVARLFENARGLESRKDYRRAEVAYELVLRQDPGFAAARLALGRVRAAQGDRSGAIEAWAALPAEAEAVAGIAGLVAEQDPERAAGLYQRLQRLRLGDSRPWLLEAKVRVAFDPVGALAAYKRWQELEDGVHDGPTAIALAQTLRAEGHEEEAVALLEDLLLRDPSGPEAGEALGRLDRIQVERAARTLAIGGGELLDEGDQARVDRARRLAAEGDPDGALALLRQVVLDAPRAAEARGALGEVYLQLGSIAEAEQAWVWATALSPEEPTWRARLGLLLAQRYGGRRHSEAIEELGKALSLRPSWSELHYHLGLAHQETGAFEEAVRHLSTFIDAQPEGAMARDAASRIRDLQREAPEAPRLPPPGPPPADVPEEALEHYRIARVYLDKGDLPAARAELVAVRRMVEGWPAATNLEAALAMREGETEVAVDAWQRSLAADPEQPRVRLALGEVLRRQGRVEEAHQLLEQAAEGGAADAWYLLAAMAYEEHRFLDSRAYLERYFERSAGDLSTEPARELRDRIDRRVRLAWLAGGGSLGTVVLGIFIWLFRRRGVRTVTDLAERVPEAVHDLARILAAIRHEVIKHNTTLLDDVAHALEHGDHHAVSFAAQRLFGEGGSGGVVARFEEDLDGLVRLGRQHGMRLEPRRRDPVLSPLWRAMRRLRRLEPALRRPWKARASTPAELRALSRAINQEAYARLGALLRGMGTILIDLEQLVQVDERVRQGAELANLDLPPLERFGGTHAHPVKVFRGDLEDILANLLRNAYLAMNARVHSPRIGLELDEVDDPITGLEEVVIRVWDMAPGELTEQMIRGRHIGRGLGLVTDLVTRHDGSIGICAPPGPEPHPHAWSKAVEVRLPRAESEDSAPARVSVEPDEEDSWQ